MRAGLFYDLGLRDYGEVRTLQIELVEARIQGRIPDTLILVEHPPVFTIGKHGGHENILSNSNIPVYEVERGGNVTFHGPGQLVAYFIFKVSDVHDFSRNILRAGADLIRSYGFDAYIKKGYPGIWVGDEKIASIGLAVRKWVTFHGIAINVNVDLRYFDMIIPCGIKGVKMTSLKKLTGKDQDMETVKRIFVKNLEDYLGIKFPVEFIRHTSRGKESPPHGPGLGEGENSRITKSKEVNYVRN